MFFGPLVVNVFGIKVNAMDRNSSMNLAPSPRVDTFLTFKQNYGLGEENGDFSLVNLPLNFVNDSDVNDTNAQKSSIV
ncbi:hypothetical protein DCC39_00705 [Pueribacillus theae]|uniref:Uncharacterized protein n=1 Tax=Pueribacillus theae TaxID=2171751 RepID=A0A2U1K833_9BACI|nr:hypothetical protein [Pueribacillus theae]PWA13444.1 hypothetical protein DCC39_00705 [Pueribacillus theae]